MLCNCSDYESVYLSGNIIKDTEMFTEIFKNDETVRIRHFCLGGTSQECVILYTDGMANSQKLDDSVVRSAVTYEANGILTAEEIAEKVLYSSEVSLKKSVADMLRAILYGDTVLLTEGSDSAVLIDTKGWRTRGITEPLDERVLSGPREGFGEAAMLNIAMIRRKLQTPDLCVKMLKVGRRSETMVFICYLGSLANSGTVNLLKEKIGKIDIDGVLDSNYIEELICGKKYSLFKSSGSTERPDIVAARLLEGRIAVVVDGTPMVLTVPYLFSENFQSDEDYYLNFLVSSVNRVLRWLCFFISVSVPALFIAFTNFHLKLLPTDFAVTVSRLRGGVPMPAVIECIILILVFEMLKETGVRMPQSLGHALSIVGGLVVGQAAVEASIVSAPMLIAVAMSGIAGLMIPRLKTAVFYLRIINVLACALLGCFGFFTVFTVTVAEIFGMESYGVDATVSLCNPSLQSIKDTVVRLSWKDMRVRPLFNKNRIRKGKEE